VELTDSRQALAQARSDDVQARADLDTASSRLVRALGSAAVREEPAPEGNR
jgi:outer membrane protein TolC